MRNPVLIPKNTSKTNTTVNILCTREAVKLFILFLQD